ncbi:MAG: HAD family phosphatase [Candidatus Falkowbacteria bacterium]
MKKFLDLDNIEAVIFDMDGTMIDNMTTHKAAWKEFCLRKEIRLTDEDFKKKISGLRNDQIFVNLFGQNLTKEQIKSYAQEKESVYRELYRPIIHEVAGLSELLKRIHQKNIRLAVATTAPVDNRNFAFEALGNRNVFEVVLGEESVTKGKPDPEIYLKTADLLQVRPNGCLVFEDTPVGVKSALNAGMRVVGIATSHSFDELSAAELVVTNFLDIELR